MQPYTQQYQEPTPNFNPIFIAGAINGSPLYNQPICSTNVIQPILTSTHASTSAHKRRSLELDDDSMIVDEPPAKQLLSEKNLFKKFGSLNICGTIATDIELDEEQDIPRSQTSSDKVAQEEFNRYVYLVCKDIEGNDPPQFKFSNSTMDRLAREERDKLCKAVILWSPPISNRFCSNTDDDDDTSVSGTQEDLTFSDQNDVTFSPV